MVASVRIARVIFERASFTEEEYEIERQHLLTYCKLDTWAMVKLLEALRALSDS